MIYCNPGPGKHLCSYAMIKSKLNLVLLGESPIRASLQGTPGNQILGRKKNKMYHFFQFYMIHHCQDPNSWGIFFLFFVFPIQGMNGENGIVHFNKIKD